jgi:hypothetical protein
MDQTKKMQLKVKLVGARSHIVAAKGMANLPALPNAPVVGLQPIVSALAEIVDSFERLIDEL